jgi:hypothetical protein
MVPAAPKVALDSLTSGIIMGPQLVHAGTTSSINRRTKSIAGCELIALSIIAFLKNSTFSLKAMYSGCFLSFKVIQKVLEIFIKSYSVWRTDTISDMVSKVQ